MEREAANPMPLPEDDQFAELLAVYHEAVVEGTTPSQADRLTANSAHRLSALPLSAHPLSAHPLSARLQRGAECLQLLEDCRRNEGATRCAAIGDLTPSDTSGICAPDGQPLTRLGRFRIEGELGRGGHGIVFRAYDDTLQRPVALKVPRPECLVSGEMRLRFLREAQVAARLTHPNLLTIYESGVEGPLFYLASAYCSGPTLAEWLRQRSAPVPEALAVKLIAALADGVAYAHQRGILHRDIKPSNIFLDHSAHGLIEDIVPDTGERAVYLPRLGDFGLARFSEQPSDVTRSGVQVGTPAYMAPEQARGWQAQVGPATDVYGLGAVLFELLTGRPPFQGASDVDVLRHVVADECTNPRSLRRDLSPDLSAICARCLAKRPTDRYQSAVELVADLDRFARGVPTLARPVSTHERLWRWIRQRPALATSLAVSLLAMLSLVVLSVNHARQTSRLLVASEAQRMALEEAVAAQKRSDHQARQSSYAMDMHLAFQNWMAGGAEVAEKILQRYQPAGDDADIRDVAWWMLKRMSEEAPVFARHADGVTAAAVSPDGQMFATVGKDRVIHLWQAADGKLRAQLRGHTRGAVNALAFSPDGSLLVSVGDDLAIRRWSVADGQSLSPLGGSTNWNADVEFSLDGRLIASGGGDRTVRLWYADSGAPAGVLTGHQDTIRTLAFTASQLFSASEDGEVRCWDLSELESSGQSQSSLLHNPTDSYVFDLAVERPGDYLLGSLWQGGYVGWDVKKPDQLIGQFHKGTSPRSIACAPNCTVALGMADGSIQFSRSEEAGQTLFRLRPVHADRVVDVAFVPGTDQLLTASRDGTVRLLPVPINICPEHSMWRPAYSLRWRENLLTSVCGFNSLYVFDVSQRRLRYSLVSDVMMDVREADSVASRQCSVLFGPNELKVLRWSDGGVDWSTELVERSQFALDPQDRFVAVTQHREAVLYDLSSGEIVARLPHPSDVRDLEFGPDGQSLLTVAQDRQLRVWDVRSKCISEEHELDGVDAPSNLALSADGQWVAVIGNELHIWNRSSQTWHGTVSLPAAPKAVALLGRGEVVAVQESSGVRLYRVADGAEVLDLRGHVPLERMAASPDGSILALQKDMFLDFLDGRPQLATEK